MAPVDGNLSKDLDLIDLCPCDLTREPGCSSGIGPAVELNGEKPLPPVGNDGGAANSGHLLRRALDSEGKEDAAFVFDSRIAASEEPQSAAIIEVARVSGSVPTGAIDIELCFRVALATEVSGQHVRAADNDLS